ncbi:hypothetical protein SAMD00079811_76670 (plasmid) [Scytonema sp. HK-05]|nr:hypothetical protein SAMD00079811_76670 [Scytonema sp. HK-05]
MGVAESRDDSCGVGILPAQKIQGTGKMPIPQEHKIHPANMQRHSINSPQHFQRSNSRCS